MTIVKIILPVAAEGGLTVVLFDVICGFLYWDMRDNEHIEQTRQDPWEGDDGVFGELK